MAVIETKKEATLEGKIAEINNAAINKMPPKPQGYDKFLMEKGYTYFFPDTKKGKEDAERFAKDLRALGYDTAVIREQNIVDTETYNYMLQVGKRATQQPLSPEEKELANRLAKSAIKKMGIGSEEGAVKEVLSGGEKPKTEEPAAAVPKPLQRKKPSESLLTEEDLGLVPRGKVAAGEKQTPQRTEEQLQAELLGIEKQLKEDYLTRQWKGKTHKETRITTAYRVMQQIKENFAAGTLPRPDTNIKEIVDPATGRIVAGGEIDRDQKRIEEFQALFGRAEDIIAELKKSKSPKTKAFARTHEASLERMEKQAGEKVVTYLAVNTIPVHENFRNGAPLVTPEQLAKEQDKRLIAAGLENEKMRKLILQALAPGQINEILEFVEGRRKSLDITLSAEAAKNRLLIDSAITRMCLHQSLGTPVFSGLDLAAYPNPEKLVVSAFAPTLDVSEITKWDEANYLAADEKERIAKRFDLASLRALLAYVSQCASDISQGREPKPFQSSDAESVLLRGGLDKSTTELLRQIFLSQGLVMGVVSEKKGALSFKPPERFVPPEEIPFHFPSKISHAEPGGRERWLNFEVSQKNPESDVATEKLDQIENAINSDKGGRIRFGKLLIETEDLTGYDAYLRKAKILAGYLNSIGIPAKVDEIQAAGKNGVELVIPANARMAKAEEGRKPPVITVTTQVIEEKANTKEDVLASVSSMPQLDKNRRRLDSSAGTIKKRISEGVANNSQVEVACNTESHARRLRNWLVQESGIPAEQLRVYSREERKVQSFVGEEVYTKETVWMLRYTPQIATPLALGTAPKKAAPEVQLQGLLDRVNSQVDEYMRENPGIQVSMDSIKPDAKTETPNAYQAYQMTVGVGQSMAALAYILDERSGYRGGVRRNLPAGLVSNPDGTIKVADPLALIKFHMEAYHGGAYEDQDRVLASVLSAMRTYPTMDSFIAQLDTPDAILLKASSAWLADQWLKNYSEASRTPEARAAFEYLAMLTMVAILTKEGSPAHFGVGPSKTRPTVDGYMAGAVLSFKNTTIDGVGEDGKRARYKTYFTYENENGEKADYNIVSRILVTAGGGKEEPKAYITAPTADPKKVYIIGTAEREYVNVKGKGWIPVWKVNFVKGKKESYELKEGDVLAGIEVKAEETESYEVKGSDSLAGVGYTKRFTDLVPALKLGIEEALEKTIKYRVIKQAYEMSYEGEQSEAVKWRGKVPKPELAISASAKTKEGASVAPRPSKYFPESEFTYTVLRLVEKRSITGTKEERYLALTEEAANKNKGLLATEDKDLKVRSAAELSNGRVLIYRVGEKIIDAEEGARLVNGKKNRLEVGSLVNGKIVSTSAEFSAEALEAMRAEGEAAASRYGFVVDDGKIYLSVRQEEIGTYSLVKEGDAERASLSLKSDIYKNLVSVVISGSELMASKNVKIDGKTPGEYEKAYNKAGAAKAGKSRITVAVPLPEGVRARGDDTYFTWGEFAGPKEYVEEMRVEVKK